MAIIKRRTKRAITKQVKKLVKRHGPEIALGLATGLIGTVINAATADAAEKPERPKAKGKKQDDGDRRADGAERPEKKRDKKADKKTEKKAEKKAEKTEKKSKKNSGGKKPDKKGKQNEAESAG